MHVCMWVYMYVCMCVHVEAAVKAKCPAPSLSTLFFEIGSFTELTDLARRTVNGTPEIWLPPHPPPPCFSHERWDPNSVPHARRTGSFLNEPPLQSCNFPSLVRPPKGLAWGASSENSRQQELHGHGRLVSRGASFRTRIIARSALAGTLPDVPIHVCCCGPCSLTEPPDVVPLCARPPHFPKTSELGIFFNKEI